MDWNAIAAIAEALGSAAVLVTLVYLTIQVRHARSEVQRSVNQAREQHAWWQYRAQIHEEIDNLPPIARAEFENGIRFDNGRLPVGKLWFESSRATMNRETVRYVESVLARPE